MIGSVLLIIVSWWNFEGITVPLQEKLKTSKPDELVPVNLVLKEQVNYSQLTNSFKMNHVPRKERRIRVIEYAREFNASHHQSEIVSFLKSRKRLGKVGRMHAYILINAISFEATPDVIQEVYKKYKDYIRSIDYDEPGPIETLFDDGRNTVKVDKNNPEKHNAERLMKSSGFTPVTPDQVAWGVQRIRAPELWDMGITGQGVVIANLDTGTNYNHVDLHDHIWVNPGEDLDHDGVVMDPDDINGVDDDGNGYVDDLIGWDFLGNDNDPMDEDGHGSHTAGIMVGDGTAGQHTGVAPDALLMVVRTGLPESNMLQAAEYAVLAGADVISSSLSLKFGWHQPDYATWRQEMEATLAAGVIRANSIGNQGDDLTTHPIPWNIACPGNVPPPWLHPDQTLIGGLAAVLGCGAVDQNDVIKYYSGYGPAAWENIQQYFPSYPHSIPPEYWDYPYDNGNYMGLLKPDVCAPTDVPTTSSSNNTGYYNSFGGTSAATPHLGGSMALLLSVDPNGITPDMLAEALMMGAVDLGPPGKDNRYGAGRLDLVESYYYLLSLLSDSLDPNPPESLTAYSDYTMPTSIHLTWIDPMFYYGGDPLGNDLAGIRIYNADDSTLIADVAPGVEEYTVTGLVDGNFYRFYAVAYTIYDSTSRSSNVASWYAGGHPVPAPPESLTAYSDSTMPTSITLTWNDPTTQLDGTPLDDLAGIRVYDAEADTPIAEVQPGVETYTVTDLTQGSLYRFVVKAFDNETPEHESPASNEASMFAGGAPSGDYLIWDPDPNHSSAPIVDSLLSSLGLNGVYTTTLTNFIDFLDNFGSIWIFVGIYSNNYIIESSSPEATAIANYIENGGNAYLEGGDVWYYDPGVGGYDFGPLFGINPQSDGSGDLQLVQGISGTFTEGMQFYYNGENNWIDHIQPATSSAFSIFSNQSPFYYCGVANDTTHKTVGLSFEIGGLSPQGQYTLRDLIEQISIFFGILTNVKESRPTNNLTLSLLPITPSPATDFAKIRFSLDRKATVSLSIYDGAGRRIERILKGTFEPGYHEVKYNASALSSGVYFLRLDTGKRSLVRKWVKAK